MTRDTKVGIVVSCSFLCLVGVVLVNKLREPNGREEQTSPPGQAQTEPAPAPEPKGDDKKSLEGKAPPEQPLVVANGDSAPSPASGEGSRSAPEGPPLSAPTPTPPEQPIEKTVVKAEPVVPDPPTPPTSETPAESPTKKKSDDEKPVAVATGDGKAPPESGIPTVVAPPPTGDEVSAPVSTPPVAEVNPPESTPASEKGDDGKKAEVPDPTIAPVPVPVPPTVPTVEPSVPKPEVELKPGTTRSEPTGDVKTVPTVVEEPTKVVEESPKKAGVAVGTEKSEVPLPPPSTAGITLPPSAEPKSRDGGPPPAREDKLIPVPASEVVKPELAATKEPTPAVPPRPREDARPAPVVADTSVPRPAVGGEPLVDSFSEEEYPVQAGDTYTTVSKKKYSSEKYAEALAAYNRNDSLLGDPGKEFRAGQFVSVPDVRILEKRYGHLIPGLKPATASNPESGENRIVPVAAVSSPATERGSGSVAYRVPPQGQTMREIARLTLGDGERWGEVFRLNRQHRPDFAVPGGTVLQLPADARVDAAAQPR